VQRSFRSLPHRVQDSILLSGHFTLPLPSHSIIYKLASQSPCMSSGLCLLVVQQHVSISLAVKVITPSRVPTCEICKRLNQTMPRKLCQNLLRSSGDQAIRHHCSLSSTLNSQHSLDNCMQLWSQKTRSRLVCRSADQLLGASVRLSRRICCVSKSRPHHAEPDAASL